MECEHCRRTRATLHVTLVERGVTLEVRICEVCATLPETAALLSGDPPRTPAAPARPPGDP